MFSFAPHTMCLCVSRFIFAYFTSPFNHIINIVSKNHHHTTHTHSIQEGKNFREFFLISLVRNECYLVCVCVNEMTKWKMFQCKVTLQVQQQSKSLITIFYLKKKFSDAHTSCWDNNHYLCAIKTFIRQLMHFILIFIILYFKYKNFSSSLLSKKMILCLAIIHFMQVIRQNVQREPIVF